jgi:hypothetical protein
MAPPPAPRGSGGGIFVKLTSPRRGEHPPATRRRQLSDSGLNHPDVYPFRPTKSSRLSPQKNHRQARHLPRSAVLYDH